MQQKTIPIILLFGRQVLGHCSVDCRRLNLCKNSTRVTDDENDAPDAAKAKYQYTWSLRYIDAPVLRDENKDADDDCIDGDDQRLYYTTDANMNVTAIISNTGEAWERYGYDPYGEVTIYDDDWSQEQSAATYSNSILFAGYFRDGESELYHVRNRAYHPPLGRWAQRDPAAYIDGMSLYEYVKGRPSSLQDPSGKRLPGSTKFMCTMPMAKGSKSNELPQADGSDLPDPRLRSFSIATVITGVKVLALFEKKVEPTTVTLGCGCKGLRLGFLGLWTTTTFNQLREYQRSCSGICRARAYRQSAFTRQSVVVPLLGVQQTDGPDRWVGGIRYDTGYTYSFKGCPKGLLASGSASTRCGNYVKRKCKSWAQRRLMQWRNQEGGGVNQYQDQTWDPYDPTDHYDNLVDNIMCQ